MLGLSVRQVRRYRERLNARLEIRAIIQPEQDVLTFSRQAVEELKAEREGRPAPESPSRAADVNRRPAS